MPARRAPRHDHDAGGAADVLAAKAGIRSSYGTRCGRPGSPAFPAREDGIPNFTGAEAAAQRLRELAEWQAARTVKANPDSPQLPVRQRALEDGKTVYMAVPRLAAAEPFFALDPDHLAGSPRAAASISEYQPQPRRRT